MNSQNSIARIEVPNSWAVELHCPQCGAPVLLDEADRILSCNYCRVRLIMIFQGYPEYYLNPYGEKIARNTREMTYIPYWRLRGMNFASPRGQRKGRVVDTAFLAAQAPGLPLYLGLQARVFKLRHLCSAPEGRFLRPRLLLDDFFTQMGDKDDSPSSRQSMEIPPSFKPTFVGETISLIYTPVYFRNGLIFDGLGDQPIGQDSGSDFSSIPSLGPERLPEVRFLPVFCPYCGSDLQGEKDTLVLLCRNCDRVWGYSRDELKQMDFRSLKDSVRKSPLFFLPFWRIRVKISGGPPQMPPPLIRPSLSSDQTSATKREEGHLYWLPAFKMSPSLFLTVSKAATFRQPKKPNYLDTLSPGQYYPVTLPINQAAEGLNAVINDYIENRPIFRLSPIKIEPLDYLLVFIPFYLEGNELVHQGMSLGINQTALHFGRFL